MKRLFFSIFLLLAVNIEYLNAQKTVLDEEQLWFGVLNQTRLSNKWGTWTDIHLRFKNDFVKEKSTLILPRLGLTYYVNDDVRITAGYAYIDNYPDGAREITQPEHRPWQQIQWHTKYPKIRLMQWLRLEERYRRKVQNNNTLIDGYNFNYRIRYNFLFTTPLSKKGFAPQSWQFVLNDEIHINPSKNIVYNIFDQNRFFIGLSYQITKMSNFQFGYMNLFQQMPAGNQFKNIHAARLFYFHNFDFRKPQEGNK
jgi:Protein of unknown function (DUF2490)